MIVESWLTCENIRQKVKTNPKISALGVLVL